MRVRSSSRIRTLFDIRIGVDGTPPRQIGRAHSRRAAAKRAAALTIDPPSPPPCRHGLHVPNSIEGNLYTLRYRFLQGEQYTKVLPSVKPAHLICTAFLAEALNATPTSMTTLTITKKAKQKGD
jgi:hypothetical protein